MFLSILWWLLATIVILLLILVIAFYFKGAFRDRVEYHIDSTPNPQDPSFHICLASITNSLITQGRITQIWTSIDSIQKARIEAINQAQVSIDFETFFMTPGKRSRDFAKALAAKALEGVKIRLIVDSYGTRTISKQYWQDLRKVGVDIVSFNSWQWKAPLDYAGRTHRKLLLVDNKFALIGGAGISDLWDGIEKDDDQQPWLDIEFQLEGEVILQLQGIFSQHWISSGKKEDWKAVKTEGFLNFTEKQYPILVTPGVNPQYRFSAIKALKYNSIISAQQRIWLASPYFLPDLNSQDLLVAAKKRGVDVKIFTTSKRTDKKPVYYASYEHYGKLLAGGVEIYEYQLSMTHGKMLIIDDCWVITGSANFDPRSFDHNEELDIMSSQPELVKTVKNLFEFGFTQSQQITLRQWKKRSWLRHRLLGNLVKILEWQL